MVMQMSNKPAGAFFTSKSPNLICADEEHIRIFIHELTRRMEQRLINFRRLFKEGTDTGESRLDCTKSHTRI